MMIDIFMVLGCFSIGAILGLLGGLRIGEIIIADLRKKGQL